MRGRRRLRWRRDTRKRYFCSECGLKFSRRDAHANGGKLGTSGMCSRKCVQVSEVRRALIRDDSDDAFPITINFYGNIIELDEQLSFNAWESEP